MDDTSARQRNRDKQKPGGGIDEVGERSAIKRQLTRYHPLDRESSSASPSDPDMS